MVIWYGTLLQKEQDKYPSVLKESWAYMDYQQFRTFLISV